MKKLFWPDHMFDVLEDVTPAYLKAEGIKALVLDLDNTLVPPHTARPTERALQWLKMPGSGYILYPTIRKNVWIFFVKVQPFLTYTAGQSRCPSA